MWLRESKTGRVIIGVMLLMLFCDFVYPKEEMTIVAIKSRNIEPYNTALGGFENYLHKKKIAFQMLNYDLEGKGEKEALEIIEQIKDRGTGIVLPIGTPAAKLVQGQISNIPAVFTMVLDPRESGVLPPGISMNIPCEMKFEKMKTILPNAKKIGLIYSPNSLATFEKTLKKGEERGYEFVVQKVTSQQEFPEAIEMVCQQVDCFLMIPDSVIYFPKSVEHLLLETLRKKIPVIGLSMSYTKAGAFISFECDYQGLGEQAAEIALRLLRGESTDAIGYVAPNKIQYSLNLLVAERLGIRVPSQVKKEASQLFGE